MYLEVSAAGAAGGGYGLLQASASWMYRRGFLCASSLLLAPPAGLDPRCITDNTEVTVETHYCSLHLNDKGPDALFRDKTPSPCCL